MSLVISLAAAYGAAALGGMFTRKAIPTWYAGLAKPSWNPPAWLFGPVWTVLYAMMAVSAWLVWRKHDQPGAYTALALYAVQLGLNAVWSIIFFGLRSPRAAFCELIALWLVLVATTVATFRVDRAAGLLLLPYLAWTTFAGVLNWKIADLNP